LLNGKIRNTRDMAPPMAFAHHSGGRQTCVGAAMDRRSDDRAYTPEGHPNEQNCFAGLEERTRSQLGIPNDIIAVARI
jgi:hypothetical protein